MKYFKFFLFLAIFVSTVTQAQQSYDVTFTHDSLIVYATITVPNGPGPFPTIIIDPGSGANDRDGTFAMDGVNAECLYPGLLNDTLRPYKELAEALTDSGYAVLRYDKLEYTYPQVLGTITFHKLWMPVESAINYVKTRADVDTNRIILIGHSEGSSLIPFIAKNRTDIKALISIAGPRTPFDSLFAYQLVNIAQTCNGDTLYAQLQAGQILYYFNKVRTHTWGLGTPMLFGVPPAVWFDYFCATDSVSKNYNQANIPTLFTGMGLDINVPPAELVRFQNEVTITNDFWSIPGLIHYMTPNNNPHVSKMLTDTIIFWLRHHIPFTGIQAVNPRGMDIRISPNPFNSIFSVRVGNNEVKNLLITIRNIYGQVILATNLLKANENQTYGFDLSAYPAGVYFLTVTGNGLSETTKIIKQ